MEDFEKSFGLQRKVMSAHSRARLYGGAVLIMGVDQGTFADELDVDKVKKGDLKFVHVVERWQIAAGGRVRDIMSPWFGEPNYYMRSNVPITPAPDLRVTPVPSAPEGMIPPSEGSVFFIHPSRVVKLIGLEYPDRIGA